MYVRDIKTDFFDVISTERVLVLVNTDVDAVCATKIIQYLFKCDHVLYTLVPVTGKRDFYSAFKNNIEGIKYCLLVNCGGSIDLCDFLDPADEVIFFILDNHRPVEAALGGGEGGAPIRLQPGQLHRQQLRPPGVRAGLETIPGHKSPALVGDSGSH